MLLFGLITVGVKVGLSKAMLIQEMIAYLLNE